MLPQLDPTWYASQSVWMLITFCAMFLVVWRFVIPAMRATVDVRRSRIENDIRETEKLKTEAADLLKQLEQAQASVKAETQAIIARAQSEAQALMKQTESEFTDRLAAYTAQKERELTESKKAALREIAAVSGALSAEMTQKLARIAVSVEETDTAVAAAMKEKP